MNTKKIKYGIKYIAEKANVSIGTVDRVIHNRGGVNDSTRKNVLSIINEIGYKPNLFAKSLASKKIVKIAVLVPEASVNTYWEKPLDGIIRGKEEVSQFNTQVEIFTYNATDESSYIKSFKQIITTNPDGVIFNPLFKEASLGFIELMDSKGIAYIYIDTDIELGNNIAFYGQNAKQSGLVAAKYLCNSLQKGSKILIVKLAFRKVISHHLYKRVEGFTEFINSSDELKCDIQSIEINLSEINEPRKSLDEVFKDLPNIDAVFVPNSKTFEVAEYLQMNKLGNIKLLGFDLVEKNILELKEGNINCLIGQKPQDQGYKSVMALFNHIVLKKSIQKINYSPIDIIIKENIDYYQ